MHIRSAVIEKKDGPFRIREFELDDPRPTEVLVRIVACGICQTDLHVRKQDYPVPLPLILGHEGAGVVEAVGAGVYGIVEGDHVVLSFPSCGACRYCRSGHNAYCEHAFDLCFGGARLDGSQGIQDIDGATRAHGHFFAQSSFSTHVLADRSNVVKVPSDLPLEILAPLGCGFQTGAGTVLNAWKMTPGATLAVFGVGAVGLAAVMAARIANADTIVAVDNNPAHLKAAAELGATHLIDARGGDIEERLKAVLPGGFGHVLEVTARPDMLALATRMLAPRGSAALVGGASKGTAAPIEMDTLLNGGRTVCGIVQGDAIPQIFIPQLIEFFRRGLFPFDRLLSFYEFANIDQAVEDMKNGHVIKAVLKMSA